MMNLDRNQIFWLAALLVFVFLLWLLSDILLPFVGGIALAYIQAPIADWLERFGMNRTAATLLIVSVVMVAIILLTSSAASSTRTSSRPTSWSTGRPAKGRLRPGKRTAGF